MEPRFSRFWVSMMPFEAFGDRVSASKLNSTGFEGVGKPSARHFDSAEVYKTELKRVV